MITIKDIAKAANVTPTTVSNVIHKNYSRVSKETVEKIQRIIESNGYVPNMSARSLVSNKSRIVGVINHLVPSSDGSFLHDPFHIETISGIERTLGESDYFMMLRSISSQTELMSLLKNWNLDGLILVGLFHDSFYDALINLGVPVVLIDSYINDDRILRVGLEDFKGGYIATKHLIENGHRNILMVSPKIRFGGVMDERLKGYREALKEAGIRFNKDNVYQNGMSIRESVELGQKLSERRDFTAIFATADLIASGLIVGLTDKGVRVPDDVSVVGFDDLDTSNLVRPRLTTIHQDANEKGRIAAKMLVETIQAGRIKEKSIVLPVNLIERESVSTIDTKRSRQV